MKITVKKQIIGKKMLNNYDYITKFNETLICVLKDDKYGFINKDGKEVVKPVYDWVDDFFEGLARVEINDKWGFINKEGKKVVKPIYDWVSTFEEDLAKVEKDGKYGLINKKGEEVVKPIYDRVGSFSEGLASVKKNGKWGFINKTGEKVIKPIYDAVSNFGEEIVFVQKEDSWYIIDLNNPTYEVSIDLQDRTIRKQFSDESKADEFLNAINSYIKKRSKIKDDEERKKELLIEKAKKDILEINNSYKDDVEKEFNNCYKKSMN